MHLSDIRFFTVLAGLLFAAVLTSGWTSNAHPATNVFEQLPAATTVEAIEALLP